MHASDLSSAARSCPHARAHTPSEGSNQGWGWLREWVKNSYGWFSDLHSTGCLSFLETVMRLPPEEGEGFCPFKWVPVAHRINTLLITDFNYWDPLFGKQKGREVVGGVELEKLGDMALGHHTPLTLDDPEEHKTIKSLCMENNFGFPMVKHQTPEVASTAELFFGHTCFHRRGVDMTDVIRQYVSRTNTLALFGPTGSRARETLRPLFFNRDGSPNTDWNPVPQAVDTLGQAISDWVMYSPSYFANVCKDKVDKCLWGDRVEGGIEKQQKALQEAAALMIEKSKEALSKPSTEVLLGEKPVKGQLELMLESGIYTPRELQKELLAKIERDLVDIFRDPLGWRHELVFSFSFARKT